MLFALTRAVSPALSSCELTHAARVPIDAAKAARQHAEYERALTALGCTVHQLPPAADLPDSVFVEDTAVILDDIGIVMRPGAASRRPEVAAVEEFIKHHRLLGHITAPGTMDGGDVLVANRTIFVGATTRTNAAGIDQLKRTVEYFGYVVKVVDVRGCLHLKSAVTLAGDDVLLLNRAAVAAEVFAGFDLIDVHPSEPGGANVVRVKNQVLAAAAFPRTRERLESFGCHVTSVDVSEIAKAEGAVTCCSVIFGAAS